MAFHSRGAHECLQTRRAAATMVIHAKTQVWKEYGEAMKDLRLAKCRITRVRKAGLIPVCVQQGEEDYCH